MVGPLSAAGTMAERIKAVHRWCVTGGQPTTATCTLGAVVRQQAAPRPAGKSRLASPPLACGSKLCNLPAVAASHRHGQGPCRPPIV